MKNIFITMISVGIILSGGAFAFTQNTSVSNPPNTSVSNPPNTSVSNPQNIKLENPLKGGVDSLFGLLRLIIDKILLPIGGILAVLAFIYSGFLYVTAQGSEDKIKKAHNALLWTAVGTALLLGAWVFAGAICGTIAAIADNPNLCPK